MIYNIVNTIFYASLFCSFLICLYRYRQFDSATRTLSVLICCALIVECAADYLARVYHNNLPLYAIYGLVEYGIICLYFNKVIDVFKKWNIGVYIGILGILLGTANLLFLQGINSLTSYFLFFESVSIVGMSLFAFFRLLLIRDDLILHRHPHFWFISILLFFWSAMLFNWGLFDFINVHMQHAAWIINLALITVSAITYICFIFVFLFYPKMQQINE